jgi:SAM-dependent methyltransferase
MSEEWDAAAYDASFGFVTQYGAPLLELLDARAGERILDVGCGTGHQAAELATRGCSVVGVDFDPSMLGAAQARYRTVPGLAFARVDAQDPTIITLPAVADLAPYDAVLSNAALHWMTRADVAIENLHALVRPRGRLVVEQGGIGNVRRMRDAIAAALVDLGIPAGTAEQAVSGRWSFPSPGEQAVRLERAGFVVRRMELYERPTPLGAQDTAASWMHMFLRWAEDLVGATRQVDLALRVDHHAAALGLLGPNGWWADYVRLRYVAEAVDSAV